MTQGILIGAYERDNFGDLLFLHQTRQLLGDRQGIASAPMPADMTPLLGENIQSTARLLSSDTYGFAWSVGGEVGKTSMGEAYEMAVDDRAAEAFRSLRQADRRRFCEEQTFVPWFASPYLPRISRFEKNLGSPYVINSVGVSGAAALAGRHKIEVEAALADADFISVREARSHAYLQNLGIAHKMAPDIVHTITETHQPAGPRQPDLALVQIKAAILEKAGIERFAQYLIQAPQLRKHRLRLFSAGTARGHDSDFLLKSLHARLSQLDGPSRFEISESKLPWEKVDEIANAGLWIGTSLHGFIISAAYGVPRVGIEIGKLATYAASWDDAMPTRVPIGSIDAAVEAALSLGKKGDLQAHAQRLCNLALANAREAVAIVDEGDSSARHARRRLNNERAVQEISSVNEKRESLARFRQDTVTNLKQSRLARLAGDLIRR